MYNIFLYHKIYNHCNFKNIVCSIIYNVFYSIQHPTLILFIFNKHYQHVLKINWSQLARLPPFMPPSIQDGLYVLMTYFPFCPQENGFFQGNCQHKLWCTSCMLPDNNNSLYNYIWLLDVTILALIRNLVHIPMWVPTWGHMDAKPWYCSLIHWQMSAEISYYRLNVFCLYTYT